MTQTGETLTRRDQPTPKPTRRRHPPGPMYLSSIYGARSDFSSPQEMEIPTLLSGQGHMLRLPGQRTEATSSQTSTETPPDSSNGGRPEPG